MLSSLQVSPWRHCPLLTYLSSSRDGATFFADPLLPLLNQDGEQLLAGEALDAFDYVCVYMSAHWCPSCREFTPMLKDFFEAHHEKKNFAVVFLSLDNSEEEMLAYFHSAHGDYFCVPWDKVDAVRDEMDTEFDLRFIPTLLVFQNASEELPRELLCVKGREHVVEDPDACDFPWEGMDPPSPEPEPE